MRPNGLEVGEEGEDRNMMLFTRGRVTQIVYITTTYKNY